MSRSCSLRDSEQEMAAPSGHRPLVVAIVGGSGSGKSWLADQLQGALGQQAARLSQDDFYRDRSHLPMARRGQLNYDHPRAIDWPRLEEVLRRCLAGHPVEVPRYDFATHCREPKTRTLEPAPILLLDGLWLLHRRSLRRLFALSLFLACPAKLRLRRRLARDQLHRGRALGAIREQFHRTVEPMHRRFVAPQARWADWILEQPCSPVELARILERVKQLRGTAAPGSPSACLSMSPSHRVSPGRWT